jgi:negative modulator of initiation of replication
MKMKALQIDAELYDYIARQTQHIGESASAILRRLLKLPLDGGVSIAMQHHFPDTPPTDLQQALKQLLNAARYRNEPKSIGRLMQVLSTLYAVDAHTFAQAAAVTQGRTRRYFACDQQTLQQRGLQTKPQQIPETPYWVITNTNAERKRVILKSLLTTMQVPNSLIEALCVSL